MIRFDHFASYVMICLIAMKGLVLGNRNVQNNYMLKSYMTSFVGCTKQLIHQLPQAVDVEIMTEHSMTEMLLSLPPTVEVMFHNRRKIV